MASKARQRSGSANGNGPAPVQDWLGAISRAVTALAMIAIVVVAWLQWKTLATIERFLDATQRPWISASVEPVQLVFDDTGGGITLRTTIRNIGSVPAVDVLATPVLLIDAKQPYRQACRQYGVGGGFGPMLSNNEVVPKTATAWLSRSDFGQNFPSLVAVCIKYRFANSRHTGEAGYLFSIVQRQAGRDAHVVEAKNGTLSPPELALLPAGSYHD